MSTTAETVRRLWALCAVLRDEGVTYHEYLTELTYVLFLKLAEELKIESRIDPGHRWASLLSSANSGDALATYTATLEALGASPDALLQAIFAEASTRMRTDAGVRSLLAGVNEIDWSEDGRVEIGDVYEGLIQKSAQEARYGAGQYFTPRDIVDTIVAVLKPSSADTVYDPAAGTAGFLVGAGTYVRDERAGSEPQPTLFGTELSTDVHRLGVANLVLHQLDATYVIGDALRSSLPPTLCTLCMTNPPFGVKGSIAANEASHLDFPTSNKQLAFLQHVYSRLAPGGRAAVIVPDNVLFETGVARAVRVRLMDRFALHTVLRLPTGIFYATGVKTSVLFFAALDEPHSATKRVWFYDLRAERPRRRLNPEDLQAFREAYGADPLGGSLRRQSPAFRPLERDEIARLDDRLDIGREWQAAAYEQAAAPLAQVDLMRREIAGIEDALAALARMLTGRE